jgi:hypothetical protein
MLIGDVFERDVTRPIPPVVYFHEQEPAELQREVEEYIITGGYPPGDSRAIEDGIHEQFVRLLRGIRQERETLATGHPACWVSGFYGSGKSSFAKLLGLALDCRKLPDGRLLSDALLAQDRSPDAHALHKEWALLTAPLKTIAVVFDVGSRARDDEQIHSVIVRQLQHRLDYSKTSNLVAEHELRLELEGLHDAFLEKVLEVHKKPWGQLKDRPLAEDYFSAAMHALQPALYIDPMTWVDVRSGSRFEGKKSAADAVDAIDKMLEHRCPGRTLFLVIDEVSQYVHHDDDRMLGLQSFVSELGQRMKGRAWVIATGQQRLEEFSVGGTAVVKMKDRFPPSLRVHLGVANIRDVVHRRLLRKAKVVEADLRDLYKLHRPDLSLYAYKGEDISETDFVEVYPMLPGQIPLLLDITTGLRSRSSRRQGDASAIRGLLQLLGDLFREKDLARYELGYLVTVDLIYDILHTGLDPDVQMTIGKALELCTRKGSTLMARVVKAVAMLELVQDHQKTSSDLIARCLYQKLGDANVEPEVQKALDALVGESLLGYSEKTGYKIESSAGQEWQRERDDYAPTAEQHSESVREALYTISGDVEKVELDNLALPWLVLFSDSVGSKDVHVRDERKLTVVTVDLQFTRGEGAEQWVPRSDTTGYRDRIVWVVGDIDAVRHAATKLVRSARMIERYSGRQSSLADDKQRLLIEERNRFASSGRELADVVKASFMSGHLYFRGRDTSPKDVGASFTSALAAFGRRIARELYPTPTTYSVTDKDIVYLFDNAELSAPPPVFGQDKLGLVAMDAGRYELTCNGRVPSDIIAYVREYGGVAGATLLAHFASPPHGVPPDVQRAAVIGLLRAGRLRIELPGVGILTSVRDEGARELLKDTGFRKAKLTENTKETLNPRDRNAICALFKDLLGKDVARDNDAIADAVADRFAGVRERLTELGQRFRHLPKTAAYPQALEKLESALETCRKDRRVEPTILAVKRALPDLRDGLTLLRRMETDLTEQAVSMLRDAEAVLSHTWPGLIAAGASDQARASAVAIEKHLATERCWEDAAELVPHVARIRDEYRERRRAVLEAHGKATDQAIDRVKRRAGFEKLDGDQRHAVLRTVREGSAPNTDERAVAPSLDALDGLLAARRDAAERRAMTELDALLETMGARAVVEVTLELAGREIETEAELERALDEIRRRVVHELTQNHRVRFKA